MKIGGGNHLPSFNGAALFQVRKEITSTCFSFSDPLLQWGRTLSSAERSCKKDSVLCMVNCFNGAALFQVRKGGPKKKGNIWMQKLQWGRTLSSAESCDLWNNIDPCILLQWGRTLSSAESGRLQLMRNAARKASMGPHSFKCGKRRRRMPPSKKSKSFNGAALFQVRKGRP